MPPIFADPDRLLQVFINLITNAAQAIGADGSIEIVTRSICLSGHDLEQAGTSMLRIGEPVISVDIRDSGPGISAEHEKCCLNPLRPPVGEGRVAPCGFAQHRYHAQGIHSNSNRPEGRRRYCCCGWIESIGAMKSEYW
jgi:hypothetical protein